MQLLAHLAAMVSPRGGRIARPCRSRGGLRPCGSLFVEGTAPGGSQDVTESHAPRHLSEVPLPEAGFTVRLPLDPGGKTLFVIDVSQLEPGRGSIHWRDQGDC